VELIWPLPGETYDSFRDGLTTLCRRYADTVIVYPQLMLHNTPMYQQRELYGIRTAEVPSETSEAELVIGTSCVSEEECRSGYWLNYALHMLYNMRGLFVLAGYLDETGTIAYGDLLAAAADYFRRRTDTTIGAFLAQSLADLANYDLLNSGKTAHLITSAEREEFDRLLSGFAQEQLWWRDPLARELFELDLLLRPYVYREPVRLAGVELREVQVVDQDSNREMHVEVSAAAARVLVAREMLPETPDIDGPTLIRIDHRARQKMPYMATRSLEHNANYCQGVVLRFREVLPVLSRLPVAAVHG
jgi:hypothetical protein